MRSYDRIRFRRAIVRELRNVRAYRQALRVPDAMLPDEREHALAWVRVCDDLLATLREEPDGKHKAQYVDDLYGMNRRPRGNARYVTAQAMHAYHMSEDGLRRWRENAVFTASILAVQYGAMDLSSE